MLRCGCAEPGALGPVLALASPALWPWAVTRPQLCLSVGGSFGDCDNHHCPDMGMPAPRPPFTLAPAAPRHRPGPRHTHASLLLRRPTSPSYSSKPLPLASASSRPSSELRVWGVDHLSLLLRAGPQCCWVPVGWVGDTVLTSSPIRGEAQMGTCIRRRVTCESPGYPVKPGFQIHEE